MNEETPVHHLPSAASAGEIAAEGREAAGEREAVATATTDEGRGTAAAAEAQAGVSRRPLSPKRMRMLFHVQSQSSRILPAAEILPLSSPPASPPLTFSPVTVPAAVPSAAGGGGEFSSSMRFSTAAASSSSASFSTFSTSSPSTAVAAAAPPSSSFASSAPAPPSSTPPRVPSTSSALPHSSSSSSSSFSCCASSRPQAPSSRWSAASAAVCSSPSSLDDDSLAPPSSAAGLYRGVEHQHAALTERYLAYLRSIKDNWSSCHAARLVTPALLSHVRGRFLGLSTPLKVRVLTSFLYLPSALTAATHGVKAATAVEMRRSCLCCCVLIALLQRESSKPILLEILHEGETDPNEWVKKLSRILLPFVTTGRVDLRETDTETAFRIIHFLDEQRAQHPEEGQYRRKAGLEQQHLCDPAVELAAAEAAAAAAAAAKQTVCSPEQQLVQQLDVQQTGALEMTLFSARLNFDDLVKGIVRRGTRQLQQAMVSQQQREAAAAAAQQQQQHSSPHLPLRKSSVLSSLR